MIRTMQFFGLLGLLVLASISEVFAETIPAELTAITSGFVSQGTTTPVYESADILCQARQNLFAEQQPSSAPFTYTLTGSSPIVCTLYNRWGNPITPLNITPLVSNQYICPANQNWIVSGQTCTRPDCDSGYDRDVNGVCKKDCTAKQGTALPNTNYDTDQSGNGQYDGCRIHCDKIYSYSLSISGTCTGSGCESGGGQIVMNSTQCKYTGASSQPTDFNSTGTGDNPKPSDPSRPQDCLNSGQGYVTSSTGSTRCLPSSEAPIANRPKIEETSGNETKTTNPDGTQTTGTTDQKITINPDGTTTTTTTHTTTNPDGSKTQVIENTTANPDGSITQNTTTKTINPDGTTATSKTDTAESTDKESFCSSKPDDPLCKPCPDGSDKATCATLGTPGDAPELATKEIGVTSIGVVSLASNATCPQGPLMPFGLGHMPLDGICQLASGIRPIILALAWLSAGLIVVGAFRET